MTNVVETYKSMIAGSAGDFLMRAKTNFAKIIPIKVFVECGLHAGSSQICDAEQLQIGDDMSDAIMLVDPSIRGDKVFIQNLPSIFSPFVAIETSRTDVFANGKKIDGKILKRLPFCLKIADVSLRLSKGQPSQINWHASGAMFAASLAVIAFSAERYLARRDSMPIQMVQAEEHVEAQTGASFELVKSQISSAGLEYLITANENLDGSISISGNLPLSQMDSWNNVRQEIDRVTFDVPIQSNVNQNSGLPELPPFAAISLAENPQLILAGGERWSVGSSIGQGWLITKITDTHILVERGTEQIEVSF